MSASVLIAVTVAFVLAVCLPALLRPALRWLGALDAPNERSSHSKVTIRGGGVAPLIGFAVGAVPLLVGGSPEDTVAWFIVIPAVAVGVVGVIEDVRGLPIALRAGAQLLLGVGVGVGCASLSGQPLWTVVVAAIAFAGYVNIANFMDGVNGISGLHGAVAGAAYAVLGAMTGLEWLLYLGLLVAAVFVAFLPWNLTPPGLFLGDVGSYFLGGSLAALCLAAIYSGANPVAAVAPLAVYLTDAGSTMLRRAYRGEAILRPHRSHVYQRLTDTGLTHLAVALTVALATVLTSGLGLLVEWRALSAMVGVALIGLVCGMYLTLPRLRGSVLPPRPSYRIVDTPPVADVEARPGFLPRRIAVLGSTGFVGDAVTRALRDGGADVVTVRAPRLDLDVSERSASAIALLASEMTETDELAMELSGCDLVINAAGAASPDDAGTRALFGANSLLPAVVAAAARRAHATRVIHVSSAAVQGRRLVLDESLDVAPFSPYSLSKALGERAFLAVAEMSGKATDLIIVRATSVQGPGRPTTASLRRIASSRLSSVAAPGTQPTVVSSIDGLTDFLCRVASETASQPPIRLQPWEGLSVSDVLIFASSRRPTVLPRFVCRTVLVAARAFGHVIPEIAGVARRLELMWLGQDQLRREGSPVVRGDNLRRVLNGSES